jgi:hypothetical protein
MQRRVSDRDLGGLFSSRQLVEMASSIPARVAYIDDKAGTLKPGMLADLFLVRAPQEDLPKWKSAYDAILTEDITAVDLVMIDGVPLYGKPELLKSLHLETEPLEICGSEKALNAAALPNGSFAKVESRLRDRMKAMDSELGPLDSCPGR